MIEIYSGPTAACDDDLWPSSPIDRAAPPQRMTVQTECLQRNIFV
jgi:hypothetical protein